MSTTAMTHILRAIKDRQGATSIEFALIVPLMVTLYLGVNTLAYDFNVTQKVEFTAQTLASLVAAKADGGSSGMGGFNDTEINDVFAAATPLMAPLSSSHLEITISEIKIDGVLNADGSLSSYKAKTNWSVTRNNGTLRPCSELGPASSGTLVTPETIPASFLKTTNDVSPDVGALIAVDAVYTYTLPLKLGSRRISRSAFARNRIMGQSLEYNMTSDTNSKNCTSS